VGEAFILSDKDCGDGKLLRKSIALSTDKRFLALIFALLVDSLMLVFRCVAGGSGILARFLGGRANGVGSGSFAMAILS